MNYQDLFLLAKEKNITNIQIAEKTTTSSSVEFINGELDSSDDLNYIKYNLKAEYNGKTVKLATEYLTPDIIDLIIMKAEVTDSEYSDDYIEKEEILPPEKKLDFEISQEIKKLKELDNYRKENKDISKLNTFFEELYESTRIVNSKGVDISTSSHLCTFIVEVIIEQDEEVISYDQKQIKTDKTKIEFDRLTKDTIKKAIILKNKQKIDTNKYNIILDVPVSSRIISNLVPMLSAKNIRTKTSCLDKIEERSNFNKKLNIIEDPTNKLYPGYRLFDDEGTITFKKEIIKDGKIINCLYDTKEAKIANLKSTANGYSEISTKNMYVIPGIKSQEELIKEIENGILITDYMGASSTSINIATGNISLQIFGFLIKNGKIVSGIKPCIMTTTIFELLSNINEIGNDLEFIMTSAASPSLLINNISITS